MSVIDPSEWLGMEPVKRPRVPDVTPPTKPSLKERIEAIAAAGEARPPLAPLFMAAELRAIAAELGEIAGRVRQGCTPNEHLAAYRVEEGFTGEIDHGCFCSLADRLAGKEGT